ncbi:MAG: hypothetical protein JWO19_5697 [Bryobacterales bacterium]|jgi:hypothetical protein|nr:hypothetical protein [Bryobacterales bacterium]
MYKKLQLLTIFAGLLAALQGADTGPAVLWRPPTDLPARDLFYGPGGKQHQPATTMRFRKEDLKGTQPKVIAEDRNGVKWTVKLGTEARPETAASRIVWAVGYFANEDYFLPRLTLEGLPEHLHRGSVDSDGTLHNVRLKRHLKDEDKEANWSWFGDRFAGTRELNGLRVMMALLNNWDLTEENNAVYTEPGVGTVYMVSDVGSTFGTGTLTWPLSRSRGNLSTYRHSAFITRDGPDYVDFHAPGAPAFFFLLGTPREYFSKLRLRAIGHHIPIADARWIGQLLAQLSPAQIRDAFRAAEYSSTEIEGFAGAIQNRIHELMLLGCRDGADTRACRN